MTNIARWKIVDDNFTKRVATGALPLARKRSGVGHSPLPANTTIAANTLLDLFDSQLKSRHLDLIARELKEKQLSYYTIGSSGHEANAVLGLVFPYTDMAFLHYRSGAFFIQRAKQLASIDPVEDILLSLMCASADPICSGRHKVFGSVELNIPPQTSTIASHSPKALGAAMAVTRKKGGSKDKQQQTILCSFGDASFNHSTLQGTVNAMQWMGSQHFPLPLVLVCEDNGIGVSTPTPITWIELAMANRKGIHYLQADGLDLVDVYWQAKRALSLARTQQPVFFHLRTKRLLGHAGSDIEQHYWTRQEIEANEACDPLLYSARILLETGAASQDDIVRMYERVRQEVAHKAEKLLGQPKLSTAKDVMQAILPQPNYAAQAAHHAGAAQAAHHAVAAVPEHHPNWLKRHEKLLTMAQAINLGLAEAMAHYPQTVLFGEDVAKKGGVYRVTADLQRSFGNARVFDTILDEQTILGTAMGFALQGFIPIPEIQFLAFLHCAEDQLRGEAATLPFFSNGQYANPMLLRLPGLAYQKGFGGHYHNDNAFAFLREIPGVIIACPSQADRAVKLLRTCMQQVVEQQRVVIFLEPIALYHEKGVSDVGDCGWLGAYPAPDAQLAFGDVVVDGAADAKTAVITYGNGVYLTQQALAKMRNQSKNKQQLDVKVIDLCWLTPLPEEKLAQALVGCNRVVIVDESRKTGSISEQIMTWMLEKLPQMPQVQRVVGKDSFITLGESWQYLLPSVDDIVAALEVIRTPHFF